MKILFVLFVGLFASMNLVGSIPAAEKAAKKDESAGKLRHVVLFSFKEGTSESQLKEITDTFLALRGKIDGIESIETGTDVSVENKAQGFTHCFIVTFRNAKARDAYLPHPQHQALVKLIIPCLEKVLVFDFWAKGSE